MWAGGYRYDRTKKENKKRETHGLILITRVARMTPLTGSWSVGVVAKMTPLTDRGRRKLQDGSGGWEEQPRCRGNQVVGLKTVVGRKCKIGPGEP